MESQKSDESSRTQTLTELGTPQKKLNEGQEMERSYLSSHEGDSHVS